MSRHVKIRIAMTESYLSEGILVIFIGLGYKPKVRGSKVWNLSQRMYLYLKPISLPTSFEEITSNLDWSIVSGAESDSTANFCVSGLLLKIF